MVQVAMQRPDVVRVGQQPLGDGGCLDIEAVITGSAIGRGFPEQAGVPLPERLKLGRVGMFGWRKQPRHQLGRDCGCGVVSPLVENS